MNDIEPYALLINDIHASKDNISDFTKNWEEALNVCEKYHIPHLIVGGDLWQSRSAQTLPVLMAVRYAIIQATDMGLDVLIAEGNHCKIDQESNLGYSHIFDKYPNVEVVDDFVIDTLSDSLELVVMSYFPETGSFIDKLKEIERVVEPSKAVLYIHEGITGALNQRSEDELPASVFSKFKSVLVGHYHNRCKVGDNIEYIGASRQHNFGEDEEKGYTILYTDGSTQFVQNQVNPRYTTITVSPENLQSSKPKIEEAARAGKKVRVKIECLSNEIPAIDKKELLALGVNKLEIKTTSVPLEVAAQTINTKYDKSGIKAEYLNFCDMKAIANVKTGLEYLDKINQVCGN